jgi:CubicO group peptidase (beta-lactamase class C family)
VPRSGSPGNKPLAPPDFGPRKTLRYGTPKEAGLLAEHVGRIDVDVASGMQPSPDYPHYPGAVALAGRKGVIAHHEAYGYAVKYSDSKPTLLPEDEWVPMRNNTIFDIASVSKLFASMAAVQLIERGLLELEARVVSYIPQFAQNGKEDVTVRHLLTHTSGFIPWISLYDLYGTPEERIAAVYALGLEHPPGTTYAYSDFNLITIGKIVEELSSRSLDRFVAANITEPLGMNDTGYTPPEAQLDRIAATEYQPWTNRGMVRGSVHDENSYGLNGVAGHAGVFSTAYDLAILAQTILNGGRYGKARIMSPESVQTLLTNYNAAYPGHDHSLSFELYQHWYMDAMATPFTAGHTGYTGTCIVLNPLDRSFAILLTNRVHPSRDWGSILPNRRAFARNVARAVAVKPAAGKNAWFSGFGDGLDNTLDVSLTLPEGRKNLRFELWYDTHPRIVDFADLDFAAVEVSADEGATWESPSGTVEGESSDGRFTGFSGREWLDADFDLSPYAGPVTLRFRYHTIDTTDTYKKGNGRGVYVDHVRVEGRRRVLFDDRRPRDAALWQPRGWTVSRD